MRPEKLSIYFDAEGDFLEATFADRAGYFRETSDDRVMVRVDQSGEVIGFSVLGMSNARTTEVELPEPHEPMTESVRIMMEPDADGLREWIPALRGCHSWGATKREALTNIIEAAGLWLRGEPDNVRAPSDD